MKPMTQKLSRIATLALVAAAACACCATVFAQSSASVVTTKRAASGDVRAELSYESKALPNPLAEEFFYGVRLKIFRKGETALEESLPACGQAKITMIDGPEVRGFEGRESDVLVGVTCERGTGYVVTYSFNPSTNKYVAKRSSGAENLRVSKKLSTERVVEQKNIRARLSYDEDIFVEGEARLKIERAGRVVSDEALKLEGGGGEGENDTDEEEQIAGIDGPVINDFDGDGEPEIFFNVQSRGAYCCAYSLIYHYDAARQTYRKLSHFWVNYRDTPNIVDLDRDGTLEFVSQDENFSGEFGPYATTGAAPVQIWHYRRGRMLNVTRQFPGEIRKDAQAWLREYGDRRSDWYKSQVPLAAYVADMYLLGEGPQALRRVRQLYRGKDRREFLETLRTALRENGYTGANERK